MKYYAVRKGRQPGIYTTWSECQTQIYKYPGAVFKAFEDDRQAAASFLQAEEHEAPAINDALPLAYIDGSYNKAARIYSWGGYIDNGGQITILQGTGSNPDYLPERNIAGELIGALQVLFTAQRLQIPEINLYFDYEGIEAYITGEWKTKTKLAYYYCSMFDLLRDDVAIHFIKVAGHTGIAGNELADILAKEAAGAKLRKKDIATLADFKQGAGKPAPFNERSRTDRHRRGEPFIYARSICRKGGTIPALSAALKKGE